MYQLFTKSALAAMTLGCGLVLAAGCGGKDENKNQTSSGGSSSTNNQQAAASGAAVSLSGAGATFPNPVYQRWVAEYGKIHSNVRIDYASIGSGGGVKAFTEKTVDFAASDAPLNKSEIEKAGGEDNLVEFPSVAGGDVPAYNVPGVTQDLKFTGDVLADIYMGRITKWNDPKLAALNDGVALPDLSITPAWRTDGSGTTFIWTSYLATQSPEYKSSIGVGKQVKWPVGQGGKGNEGVAAIVQQTPGALGYVEEAYADQNKLTYGAVKNQAGKFVKCSPETVSAAGEGAVDKMSGHILSASLWNQPGENAYPVASFTYILVYKDLNNVKSKAQADALADYLWWATHDGQPIAKEVDYAPLAPAVLKKVEDALGVLTYQGQPEKAAAAGK